MTPMLSRLLLSSTLLIGAASFAQPDTPPSRPDDEPLAGPRVGEEPSAGEMERQLAARLEQLDREREALERAMADLKAGRDVEMPETDRRQRWRDRFRDRDETRPGGPDGPPRGPDEPREPLTDAQREQVMAFFKEHDPRMHARFTEMIERRPELAERLMNRFGHRTLELLELKENDPERFTVRLKAMQAQGQIREVVTEAIRSDTLDTPETRRKLESLVAASIDEREAEHADEIERLSSRLEELRREQAQDTENRSGRIERMVGAIIEKAKEFRENPPERFDRGRGERRGEREN